MLFCRPRSLQRAMDAKVICLASSMFAVSVCTLDTLGNHAQRGTSAPAGGRTSAPGFHAWRLGFLGSIEWSSRDPFVRRVLYRQVAPFLPLVQTVSPLLVDAMSALLNAYPCLMDNQSPHSIEAMRVNPNLRHRFIS